MFKDLGRVFRESLSAFRAELNKREPEDQVVELLSAMRKELVEARATVSELAGSLEGARAELARERSLLEQCERRGRLAEGIGDTETARVAGEFALRHRERIRVLEQKETALEAEWAMRAREAEEMKRRYQEADANRFALLAQLRRAESRQRTRAVAEESEDAFAEWGRMEERIEETRAYADALGEVDPAAPPAGGAPAADVEERLSELKRRMAKE